VASRGSGEQEMAAGDNGDPNFVKVDDAATARGYWLRSGSRFVQSGHTKSRCRSLKRGAKQQLSFLWIENRWFSFLIQRA
jgi:hypothetical protein